MTLGALGPAVARGSTPRRASIEAGELLGPFLPHRDRRTPTLADSVGEVAKRLERIATSLRSATGAGVLTPGAGGKDPLEIWITAYALGYHEGRTRAPAVDPPLGSS